MKLFLVITLLLLSTLLYEAQGINRKLMTKTIFTATTSPTAITPKNHKDNGNNDDLKMGTKSSRENFALSLSSKHLKYGKAEATPPGYADVVDLTGMDYSPARRKPPIHN